MIKNSFKHILQIPYRPTPQTHSFVRYFSSDNHFENDKDAHAYAQAQYSDVNVQYNYNKKYAYITDKRADLRRREREIQAYKDSIETGGDLNPHGQYNSLNTLKEPTSNLASEYYTSENQQRVQLNDSSPVELEWDDSTAMDPRMNRPVVQNALCKTDQVIYPAKKEDFEIFRDSDTSAYKRPIETEGGTILRVVRASDPVVSPIYRSHTNSWRFEKQTENLSMLGAGIFVCTVFASFGLWQLRRMAFKANEIDYKKTQMRRPIVHIESSPFPYNFINKLDYFFRVFEVSGVLDTTQTIFVGPKGGVTAHTLWDDGYFMVCPLTLKDGNSILVNLGWIDMETYDNISIEIDGEASRTLPPPEWATVRGVFTPGTERSEFKTHILGWNQPGDKHFLHMIPRDMVLGCRVQNETEAALGVLEAFQVIYHDDIGLSHKEVSRKNRFTQKLNFKEKKWYVYYMIDEHTHFMYAVQWFLMSGTLLLSVLGRCVGNYRRYM